MASDASRAKTYKSNGKKAPAQITKPRAKPTKQATKSGGGGGGGGVLPELLDTPMDDLDVLKPSNKGM